jgi:uncharacterized protein (DUF1015 family)
MAQIEPFRALRPQKAYVKFVAAPPYDVLSVREAREIAANNPLSFLHVEKSEIDFPEEMDIHEEQISMKARLNLEKLINEGILFQDETPCLYIYRQQMGSHKQYGLVAGVSAAEYDAGLLKRHELTRAARELERIRHIELVNAQTGPIFLVYRSKPSIDQLISASCRNAPEYDFMADDGVRHTIWVLSEETVMVKLIHEFLAVDALYIADGHHRAAAAAAVARRRRISDSAPQGDESPERILAVLFPDQQLKVLAYHRIIRDLNDMSERDFLDRIGERFYVLDGIAETSPQNVHEFMMYLSGRWFLLQPHEDCFNLEDPVQNLDVAILQSQIFAPILGIGDPRIDHRIDFVGGIRSIIELKRLVDKKEFAVAFALYPTDLDQVMSVSDAGMTMPPKSTWFEPKLLSGIFVHLLE